MSVTQPYSLRCPQCSTEFEANLYDSINRAENPELREALFANQINVVPCPSCQYSFRVDKNLLYHDPGLRFMVYGFAGGEEKRAQAEHEFQMLLSALPAGAEALPSLHMTLTRIDLVERIFILEAGLNARVIEYIKHLVYLNNRIHVDPRHKRILFNVQDSTDEQLVFVIQDVKTGQLERPLTYSRAAYQALATTFDRDDRTPSLMELFPGPVISARYALLDSTPPTGKS